MSRPEYFGATGCERAQASIGTSGGRREYEGCLRLIELARDRAKRVIGKSVGVHHHGERITMEWQIGKYIDHCKVEV